MGSTTLDPIFDATSNEVSKLPPYVVVPTGEYETDDDGELKKDENGAPIAKSEVYLVRRTGEALKKITLLETEATFQFQREIREEDEMWEREEREKEDEEIPHDKKFKVDLDWLEARRKVRSTKEVDVTYESLSLLLVNPKTGLHPDPGQMTNTLDFMIVREWMTKFVPRLTQEEGEEAPATPTEGGSETAPGADS